VSVQDMPVTVNRAAGCLFSLHSASTIIIYPSQPLLLYVGVQRMVHIQYTPYNMMSLAWKEQTI